MDSITNLFPESALVLKRIKKFSKPRRTEYMQFRASKNEVLILKNLADRMGLSLSETMRFIIRDAAKARGLPDVGLAKFEKEKG